ncbi:MAG TPA: NAD(P)/FAD-dependent oxidoreductase [Caulobacteraceae bacterium]|nr:NAD(P)/FAD-dependent oxidoreductase [Caulobacteraceae bacterium]
MTNPGRSTTPDHDAIVIGAGFAGLYAVHKLRELGFDVQGYEKGGDVGGVWYWNRYPGARCDCESYYYSYSFSRELEQEWDWSLRYSEQPEILRYLGHVADRFDLRRSIAFDTAVETMVFDEDHNLWTLTTSQGESVTARFVISAAGCISAIQTPRFAGLEDFAGDIHYTAAWPHEGVDFTGQRVGIIGTGASGVQAIPVIARQARHLTVFQRTANFVIPARNGPMGEEWRAWVKAHYDEIRAKCLASPGAVPFDSPHRKAVDTPEAERQAVYERIWKLGGLRFFAETFSDLITDKAANETAAKFVRAHIRAVVKNPEVAERLIPRGHPIATKRPPLDDDYYETFNRPNVTLVDIAAAPISHFSGHAVHTTGATYEIDALVLATGFDAMTGALTRIDMRGRGGLSLKDKWAQGAATYLGLGIAGFPNLFTITGPFSPSVVANMPTGVEHHVDWIGECLTYMREHGLEVIEPTEEAEEAWVAHAADVASGTLYPQTNSWYVGANIPGKPRRFMVYLGGFSAYREHCAGVAEKGYEGFAFQPSPGGPDRHAGP